MLVILHGWSDNARSFNRLGRTLVDHGVASSVTHVRLGDYVSMDDFVSFDDLADALQSAWQREKISTRPRSVDVVVHSTGGLVIRHWMTRFHTPRSNPIHRLLMLAPANFGSPLAHKGRSFIGRIVKGYASDRPFETGSQILKGLELASPFSWALAERDRFAKDVWYGPGRVLCTVMVGTSGYSGISAAANEDGSDGTVRVSTANLNCARIRLDFCTDPHKPTFEMTPSNGVTAFARMAEENHSTIALKSGGPENDDTLPMISEALKVTDAQFPAWVERLETYSALAREQTRDDDDAFAHGYQNTVVRLTDNFGTFVPDYFLEVFAKSGDGSVNQELTAHVQEKVVNTVHAYEDNPAFRSLLLNAFELEDAFSAKGHPVYVCVTAMPDVRQTETVGYSTFGYNDLESIRLAPEQSRAIFQPDRTLLVDLVIKRQQLEKVFRLLPLGQE
jgi:hypothetical protein